MYDKIKQRALLSSLNRQRYLCKWQGLSFSFVNSKINFKLSRCSSEMKKILVNDKLSYRHFSTVKVRMTNFFVINDTSPLFSTVISNDKLSSRRPDTHFFANGELSFSHSTSEWGISKSSYTYKGSNRALYLSNENLYPQEFFYAFA